MALSAIDDRQETKRDAETLGDNRPKSTRSELSRINWHTDKTKIFAA